MSGTSLDGIDVCIVQFEPKLTIIKSSCEAFSDTLREKLKALTEAGNNEISRMAAAELILGNEYATAVRNLLHKANLEPRQITAIGVHGQTLRHIPATDNSPGYSLQLVDASKLAVDTGIKVIADFRRKDIALGGQGAPLVPAFHQSIFSNQQNERVIVNIGGIANISTLPTDDSEQTGFDTGPGNTLLDNWYKQHQSGNFDRNGEWARSGTLNKNLFSKFKADNYFMRSAPKSTGPEYFNMQWLENYLNDFADVDPEDIQASLTELTAWSIAKSIKQHCKQVEVLVCGGGTHNQYLIERLEAHLKTKVKNTDAFGIDADDVEAVAFAWLAKQRIDKLPGNLPSATGARKAGILGGVFLPN